jgi:L-cysteine:1D-myo-inositol 2-amino-2-deoxy-alpha-D-glucopyranoside ligase
MVAATKRLGRWRAAFARSAAPEAHRAVAELRVALGGGLDTPAALDAVDAWAAADGDDAQAAQLVATAVDALLGIV